MSTTQPPAVPRGLHHNDVALLWGCSVRTILRLIHSGELEAARIGRKTYIVSQVDAAEFYARRSAGLSAIGQSKNGGRPWGG
jgi:excisionase family DNA binding protein